MLKNIIQTCLSFKIYKQIAFESRLNAFKYFVIIFILFGIFIYPKYFSSLEKRIFPILDELSEQFPLIEFTDYTMTSNFEQPVIIDLMNSKFIIDPQKKYNYSISEKTIFYFSKQKGAMVINNQKVAEFTYDDPMIKQFFIFSETIENGNGFIDGELFVKIQKHLKNSYFSSAVFFIIFCFIIGLIINLFISVSGYFYSRILNTELKWINISNISYYAITPTLILIMITYYLNLDIAHLNFIFFLTYILFFFNAIKQFKPLMNESKDL